MTTLILAIIVGLGVAFFSVQNTHGVTMTLANYSLTDIPLFIIVLASILVGLFVGFIMNIFQALSASFKIHGKDVAVKNANHIIADLKKKLDDVQIENNLLREKIDEQYISEKNPEESNIPMEDHPSYLARLRHNFGF